jgi:hypothetical protein
MGTEIINPMTFSSWDERIRLLPGASFFHSSAWSGVLHAAYGYTPLYFTIFDGATMTACLPVMEVSSLITGRRGVSLPFTDFCEPLVSHPGQFEELFAASLEYGKHHGWKSLELRGGGQFLTDTPASSSYLLHTLNLADGRHDMDSPSPPVPQSPSPPRSCHQSTSPPRSCHQSPSPVADSAPCAMPSPHPTPHTPHGSLCPQPATRNPQQLTSDAVFSHFKDTTRRNIKKATASGIKVEILETEKALDEFCRLNQITRRDHGLPPQPHSFFKAVHEHVISKGHGFVALALHDATVIAANVYFHFGTSAVYKYGASDKQHQHLRPNNLVMWEAIQWYVRNGFERLSFGRTDLHHTGLRQFKTSWGAIEDSISYHKYDFAKTRFLSNGHAKSHSLSNLVLHHTPLPILQAVGSLLYKHVG